MCGKWEQGFKIVTQRQPSPDIEQLRIGLLVDTAKTTKNVYDFVKWADAQYSQLKITHLIFHPRAAEESNDRRSNGLGKARVLLRKRRVYRVLSKIFYRVIVGLESQLLKRSKYYKSYLETFDLSKLVPNHIVIRPIISKSGFVYRFSPEDVGQVEKLGLDVLIRCGSGILRGDILSAARFGIISFHHGDNRINRGGPPGFWEVYFRDDTTGFVIQRLTEELDGGEVLLRGNFQTNYYYLLNRAALFERSNAYLKSLIERLALTRKLPSPEKSVPYSCQLYRLPTAYQSSIYLLKLCGQLRKKAFTKLVGRSPVWNVGYTFSGWRNAVLRRGIRLDPPPFHYLADPFVVSRGDKEFCFVEEFDERIKKGKIAVYELSRTGGLRIGTALEESFHLSFPYLFEYQQELYMCPETSENRDIRVYKCLEFPLRWELKKILMENIGAADTMLVEKDSKWWMLTNSDSVGDGDYCTELSIFYSDSPLADVWQPHPLNPVIVDAASARNAGFLTDKGSLFRVSQRQGFDVYGKNTVINEIMTLNDTTYEERPIIAITPSFAPGAIGTHHFHSNGKVTVFDFLTSSKT